MAPEEALKMMKEGRLLVSFNFYYTRHVRELEKNTTTFRMWGTSYFLTDNGHLYAVADSETLSRVDGDWKEDLRKTSKLFGILPP